jgi:hypothetical protein
VRCNNSPGPFPFTFRAISGGGVAFDARYLYRHAIAEAQQNPACGQGGCPAGFVDL